MPWGLFSDSVKAVGNKGRTCKKGSRGRYGQPLTAGGKGKYGMLKSVSASGAQKGSAQESNGPRRKKPTGTEPIGEYESSR